MLPYPVDRFFHQKTGVPSCEIILEDGSLMRSQVPNRKYFNHWFVQKNEQQVMLSQWGIETLTLVLFLESNKL